MDSDSDPSRAKKRREEAAEWFVLLKEPGATQADRRAFRRWLAGDPLRHDAFNEVKRLWSKLEAPAALLGESDWHRQGLRHPPSRLARGVTAMAALATCTILVTGVLLWRDPGFFDRARADYATRPGERREIILADGSHAELDGDTALIVKFDPAQREITLLRGRAWFDVTHDKRVAFIVRTGDVETRDIGTSFVIDHETDKIEVSVEQGLVSVSETKGIAIEVAAGQGVTAADGQLSSPEKIDLNASLAWRRGLIVLDHAPLGRVADELARMQPGRIMIADKELRQLTLTGIFRADDPAAILEAMRSALGLKTLSIPGFATLVYR